MFLLFLFNLYRCLTPDFSSKYIEKYKLDYCTIHTFCILDVVLLNINILFRHMKLCAIKKCLCYLKHLVEFGSAYMVLGNMVKVLSVNCQGLKASKK